MTTDKPARSHTSKPFWDAAAERRLLLQRDPVTNRWQFYPRPVSLFSAAAPEWKESAGRGELVAFTTCHSPAKGFDDEVPYQVGIVRLDEGARMFARIVNAGEKPLVVGQRMRVAWLEPKESRLPCAFEPDA